MCKLMEIAVALQLTNHIMINNLDEVFQSAYKHLHSTERAFLRVPNDILVALDNHPGLSFYHFWICLQRSPL